MSHMCYGMGKCNNVDYAMVIATAAQAIAQA